MICVKCEYWIKPTSDERKIIKDVGYWVCPQCFKLNRGVSK
jgi:hypothetical protein